MVKPSFIIRLENLFFCSAKEKREI